ncbi:GerAB/ArcD/ProY family transporter [Gracilibacillus lacisalsi]|uniref:GerAB/ArcD/ProY family transporter n=1 Tax=Gracilibacillus lacisalsi TaxID=393087 RepID=UPI000365E941|nr:endospore germination permease [Gracilibacillus lacisalsi]
MQSHGFLRTKEIASIVLIFVAIKFADSTPTLLSQKAQNGFWIIPAISFIVIFPSFLVMLYLLKKYEDKHVVQLCEAITGKWLGKLIGLVFFLFAFSSMVFDARNYIEQVKMLYFPESPTDYIFFIFIIVAFFGAKRGFEVIGYTSRIALPVIKFSALLVILLIWEEVVTERVFPVFGSGLSIIATEGIIKASIFAELFFVLIAYKATKETKMFRKGAIIASIIALAELLLFYFIYITVFDYNSIEKIAFPFHDIIQRIEFGEFFTNIETIFMVFWLFAAYLKFIYFLYFSAWFFGAVFNIDNFEPLLLPLAFLVILIGLLPYNSAQTQLVYHEQLYTLMSPFFIFLPFLLWFVAWLKGDLRT